ncbi:MAG: hypothetical protein LQ351_000342 [Letrouitia transgressa]|nr:MAG: hypothetical protein LQ351_000342 [Letrouitia transgressa]
MSAGGLEYAASVGGLISLSLTLFRGCIKAFEIFDSAAHAENAIESFRCKLELEQYMFVQWAQRAGLEDEPSKKLNWQLIASSLKQLEALLTNTQNLKEKYSLEVRLIEEGVLAAQEQSPRKTSSTSFGRLLSRLRPDRSGAEISRDAQDSHRPIARIKWAIFDKDKAEKLINDISYFNNRLYSLLDSADQILVKSALSSALRDIISFSNGFIELNVVQQLLGSSYISSPDTTGAIASAANLKQIRLRLEPGTLTTAISTVDAPKPRLRQLKPALLQRQQPNNACAGRELAHYKSKPVLVEWRLVERSLGNLLKSRVHQLAILLDNASHPSFHTLHCIGLLPEDKSYKAEDQQYICYGLVFELNFPALKSTVPEIRSLSNLYNSARKPSLNERCNIALHLAETILQLHTTGWLHKGVRSDNVIYLSFGDRSWENADAYGPYLAGYEYSRPASAHTEAIPAVPELDLYRHPRALGIDRSNFRRSFDLFALGCVILEIGLWTSLHDILQTTPAVQQDSTNDRLSSCDEITLADGVSNWSEINSSKIHLLQNNDEAKRDNLADIAFHAGNTFQKVVLLCLYANDDDPDDENLDVQKEIVEKLRQCQF